MTQKKKKQTDNRHREGNPDASDGRDADKDSKVIQQAMSDKQSSSDGKPDGKKARGKQQEKQSKPGLKDAAQFLRGVGQEYRKITWPDRKQIIQETLSVIVLVAFITILVLGYDFALAKFIFGPIEHYSKLHKKERPVEYPPITIPGKDGKPIPLDIPFTPPKSGAPVPPPVGGAGDTSTTSPETPVAPGTPTTPAAPGTPAPPGSQPESTGTAPTTSTPPGTTSAPGTTIPATQPTPAPTTTPAAPAPAATSKTSPTPTGTTPAGETKTTPH